MEPWGRGEYGKFNMSVAKSVFAPKTHINLHVVIRKSLEESCKCRSLCTLGSFATYIMSSISTIHVSCKWNLGFIKYLNIYEKQEFCLFVCFTEMASYVREHGFYTGGGLLKWRNHPILIQGKKVFSPSFCLPTLVFIEAWLVIILYCCHRCKSAIVFIQPEWGEKNPILKQNKERSFIILILWLSP